MFFCFLGGYKFLKAWNWTQIFKNNLKILNIWQQIWFKGPFYDWKNTPYYNFPMKCGFIIGYSIGWKYQPIWVSVSDLNQNSGFGRTL